MREQRETISFWSFVPHPAVASFTASASSLAMCCLRSRLCCCSWVAHTASAPASSAASVRARIIESMNADMWHAVWKQSVTRKTCVSKNLRDRQGGRVRA